MRYIYIKYVLIALISCILSSCHSYRTINIYSEDYKEGYSKSKPIYLSSKSKTPVKIYMILERDINRDEFFIRMRCVYKDRKKQFMQSQNILRFLIDDFDIIQLTAIKPAKIISYHVDPYGVEEEALYQLNREEFKKIATGKSVIIELEGKTENKIATFDNFITVKSIKDFYRNG